MLGTNDLNTNNWQKSEEKFVSDYKEMVTSFLNLTSMPKVYIMIPPPLYSNRYAKYDWNVSAQDDIYPRVIP